MKKLYPRLLPVLVVLFSFFLNRATAQNVFDVNDKDSIFGTVKPALPTWGKINKWGHAKRLTNWGGTGTTTFKSYYYDQMPFRMKFPKSYQQGVADGKTYPIYIFFHGAGEAGNAYDNEYQMYWGGQTWRDNVDNGNFDGFLFYEQSPNGYHSSYFAAITNILDSLAKYCKLDINRVIVDGLSSGGQGTWDFLGAYPQYIAAGMPISAARTDYFPTIPNYLQIPIWLFNGGLDNNPDPSMAQALVDSITNRGGYIKHTLYPSLGHGVWNNAWADPGFIPFMQAAYKSNPLVYFQKTNFCTGTPISAKLGLTSGFFAYQWMKDGVVISGATSNTITVTQLGTYAARFQRKNGGPWSDWSHTPAVLTSNAVSATPDIQIKGIASKVLPAPDGSTTVPLMEPDGYVSYKWTKVSDNSTVGTQSVYNAPVGTFTATITALNACSSTPSASFTVINANGSNKPDPAANLTALASSQTSVQLAWSKNPNPSVSETGFEVYRSVTSGTGYKLIVIRPKDSVSYNDIGLTSNTTYYYIVRAVNASAAAASSNEAFVKTLVDNTPPTAPSNLTKTGSSATSVSLGWTASTDNVAVTSYDVYINGQKAYNVPVGQTSFTVYNLTHDQTYNFQVKAKDAAGNVSTYSNVITAAAVYSGLTYQYYQGAWSVMPNFNTLTPAFSGGSANVTITPATDATNFAFLWQGYINIRKAGTYTFETNSDDGSLLWVGNAYDPTVTPLVNNDGLHGGQSKTATKTLAVGYYPITIAYFQATGGLSMNLYWTSTANGIARALIPDSAFVENFTNPGTVPIAPSNLTATAIAYNKINLSWTDNSTNETGYEVYRAPSSTGAFTTIATLGAGAVSYADTTVAPATAYLYKVRAINSFGQSAFDATGAGTQYAYYNTATTLAALPNFSTLTPASTGLWPNFSLGMPGQLTTNFAVKFDSYIKITTAGTYTFSTNSDDGSALFVNGVQVVNNDGGHGAQTKSGTIVLGVGSYPISVTYFQGTGGYSLYATYSGPGVPANTVIPTTVLGKPFATATTPVLPAAPGAPAAFDANALSNSAVNLSWNYSGTDANTFQIYRATGSNSNYRIIATVSSVPGGSYTYKDSSLFENILYYYKVNAVGVGGTGAYSNYDSARTLLSSPVITSIPDFTMRFDTKDTVNINVAFSSSVTIAIAASNLPAFATLTDNGNGTGRIIFAPGSTDQNNYGPIVIQATASNGGVGTSSFNMVVNSNHPPVLNNIPSAAFDEGTKDTLTLVATDVDGGLSGLTWTSSSLPSFASIINNGDGTAKLVLAPSYISNGNYNISITVTDAQGGASTQSLQLTINNKNPNQQYLIRTQNVTPVAAPWNNMTGPSISNILNATTGQASTISVNFTPSNWWNTFNQGPSTGNNSGVYPDNVLKEYFYFGFNGGPETVTNTISGLTPGGLYNFRFYAGSVSPYVADAGTTVYTIGGQSASLYVQGNTNNTANLNNIVADATGKVVVTMSKAPNGTPAGFLNAMEINYIYDDGTAPAKPVSLAAALLGSTGVKLTWTDIAYNAQNYFVYRSIDSNGTYTLLNPAANDGNATSYVDSSVSGHTTYYYKIKASNNYGDLGYTDNVSISTLAKNPTLSTVANKTVKANATGNIAFTASGDAGATVTVTASLPSFAMLQNLGGGSYNIAIAPTSSNTGVYNASVTATDNFGATLTTQFQIFVIENNVSSVFLHFGTDASIAPQPWNNLLGYPFANTSVSNLKRDDGTNSGITLTLLDQWSSPPNDYGMNTGDNTGMFPDVILKTSLIETTTTARRIKLSGLDVTKLYNIVLFSSANNGQKGTSTFKIGAQSVNLEAAYNTKKTVEFNAQQADASGTITVTYTKDAASVYGYLNAIIIQAYDPAIVPVVSPNFIYVEPIHTSKTSLRIGWADRSNNETGIELWRSTSMNGSYTLVTTLPAGSITYTDATLTPNTQYFYKVRAVNATAQSDYSSIAYSTTPNSIVLEHLTWNYRETSKPWNNTGINPQIGDIYGNLRDDQWNNTGVSLSIVDGPFEGETNTGLTSGNNSYIFPDNVMVGAFYVQLGSQTAVLKYSNLDQTKKYRIGFEGSTNVNVDMTGAMTINGVTKYLNAYSNTAGVVYFDGVSPDQNGEIYMSFAAKGQYGVLGALVLMSYTDYGTQNMGTGGGGGINGTAVNSTYLTQTQEIDSAELQHFTAYPNPFHSGFTLSFNNLATTEKIEIEVYSLTGQVIYRKEEGIAFTGPNSYTVNLQPDIPTGTYFAVIKSDRKILKIFKLLKAK